MDLVQLVEYRPCRTGGNGNYFFGVFDRFVHILSLLVTASSIRST